MSSPSLSLSHCGGRETGQSAPVAPCGTAGVVGGPGGNVEAGAPGRPLVKGCVGRARPRGGEGAAEPGRCTCPRAGPGAQREPRSPPPHPRLHVGQIHPSWDTAATLGPPQAFSHILDSLGGRSEVTADGLVLLGGGPGDLGAGSRVPSGQGHGSPAPAAPALLKGQSGAWIPRTDKGVRPGYGHGHLGLACHLGVSLPMC